MMNNLEDYGKYLALAAQIEEMKSIIFTIDTDHLSKTSILADEQASFQDSAAVLNPLYSPLKSDLLRMQAKALSSLYNFVVYLKECQKLKDKIAIEDSQSSEIMKMFI